MRSYQHYVNTVSVILKHLIVSSLKAYKNYHVSNRLIQGSNLLISIHPYYTLYQVILCEKILIKGMIHDAIWNRIRNPVDLKKVKLV